MSAAPKDVALAKVPGTQEDGLTSHEFLIINGLAPIPGGTIPSVEPILVYEQAVKAIQACRTIDDAKYWNNKADALAAWAKIYTDDRLLREARALKLCAYRRLGEVATMVRPSGGRNGRHGETGLLREHGFSHSQSREMVRISRMPIEQFRTHIDAKRPPSPSYLERHVMRPNPAWADIALRFNTALQGARRHNPTEVAASLVDGQVERAREVCGEIAAWIEKFFTVLDTRK